MRHRLIALIATFSIACSGGAASGTTAPDQVQEAIFAANDSMVSAMVAGTSTAAYHTTDWRGVNLNGTPMSATGFEGEARSMQYDSIKVLDREVRIYGETAALRWHANFHVHVNGQPSFAEMRLLDVYVLKDGRWLLDLTQVTPVFGTVGNPPGK